MNDSPTITIQDYARTLGLAFYNDPLFVYGFPKAKDRVKKATRLLAPTVKASKIYGGLEGLSQARGILTWLDGEVFPLSLGKLLRHGLMKVLWQIGPWDLGRLLQHDSYAEEKTREHARGKFAYIWSLGVHPEHREQGLGSRLLERAFYSLQTKGYDYCLLRTENHENVRFYRGKGFEVVHQERAQISGLEFWVFRKKL